MGFCRLPPRKRHALQQRRERGGSGWRAGAPPPSHAARSRACAGALTCRMSCSSRPPAAPATSRSRQQLWSKLAVAMTPPAKGSKQARMTYLVWGRLPARTAPESASRTVTLPSIEPTANSRIRRPGPRRPPPPAAACAAPASAASAAAAAAAAGAPPAASKVTRGDHARLKAPPVATADLQTSEPSKRSSLTVPSAGGVVS
jgi:hypothetical protein